MREWKNQATNFSNNISEIIGKEITKILKRILGPICVGGLVTAKVAVLLRLVWLWMLIGVSVFVLFAGIKMLIDMFGFIPFLVVLVTLGSIIGIILTIRREERRRRHRRRHRNSKSKNRPTTKKGAKK